MTTDSQKTTVSSLHRENERLSGHLKMTLSAVGDLRAEVERLQRIIDSRPAINAALPESYVVWSQNIYVLEAGRAAGARA